MSDTGNYNKNYNDGQYQVTTPATAPMYPPVQQQPGTHTTVILNNQPIAVKRQFTTGLCGCFEDCSSCLCGFFCPLCYECAVASKMGECCCVPYIEGGLVAMRTKLRTANNIQGSICEDCCCICCCRELAVCQMDREMKNVGILA